MVSRLTAAIISQRRQTANQHVVHLKLIYYNVSETSIKKTLRKKNTEITISRQSLNYPNSKIFFFPEIIVFKFLSCMATLF